MKEECNAVTREKETCLEMFKETCGDTAFGLCTTPVWNFNTKHVFLHVQFGREGVGWAGVFLAQLWTWGVGRPAFSSLTKEFCRQVQIMSFEWP